MKTLEKFEQTIPQVPLATIWLLNDLAEYRGKQELFARQSPQRLKRLMEHALIESAVASNRIEGVEIDVKRVNEVVLYTLKDLYQEFESRYQNTDLPPGEKTETVQRAIQNFAGPFHVGELQKQCPEVSLDMIRKVLKTMKIDKKVECLGRGKHAQWQRIG